MVIEHVTFSRVGTRDVTYAGSVKEAAPAVRRGKRKLVCTRVEKRDFRFGNHW